MDYAKESLRLHGEWKGKLEVISKVKVENKEDLSLAYTPGVAQPCVEINKDYNKEYTAELSYDSLYDIIRDNDFIEKIKK
jgi:malate dehydrogenase (oxaloacetate-decarboxylating)